MDVLAASYNIGTILKTADTALKHTVFVASSTVGAGGVDSAGVDIDRRGQTRRYRTALFIVNAESTTLGNAKTISAGLRMQHSSDGTSWDNLTTETTFTMGTTTTSTADATPSKSFVHNAPLNGARRHIRGVLNPSWTTTATAELINYNGILVYAGADEYPTT